MGSPGWRSHLPSVSDHLSADRLSALALTLSAAGLAAMTLWRSPAGLLVGTAVLAGGVVFLTPAFYRMLMSRLGPEHRGAAAATFSVFVDLGLGGGPIVFGLLARPLGIPGALAVAASVAAVGAVAVGAAGSRWAKPPA